MPRALRIKCPTWDHVERFYARKLGPDGRLSLKLPFSPKEGQEIGLVLELPNTIEISIVCHVVAAQVGPDPKKSAVTLAVAGDYAGLVARLRALTADARADHSTASATDKIAAPPVPMPLDAPVDEAVAPTPRVPDGVDGEPVMRELRAELEVLKARAAHEVLGVAWDASVADIRRGYFALVKKWHPDVLARHRSPQIAQLVSELFIHVNRAYDRMRDAAVAAGAAIAPGPALLPHRGWMAELSDIDSGGVDVRRRQPAAPPVPATAKPAAAKPAAPRVKAAPLTADSLFGDLDLDAGAADADAASPLALGGAGLAEIAAHLASDDPEAAAQAASEALTRDPRDRRMRALYHVACAHTLYAEGKVVAAVTELEAALAHDAECEPAQRLAARIAATQDKKSPRLSRLFRK